MLLTMRALTRAARAICYATAGAIDGSHRARTTPPKTADERAALLTPVAKAFSTDIGIEVASLGVQVHGGMGFIEETGAAQHYRDARIAPIYEGTNGIQAIDLVTRKLPLDGGDGRARLSSTNCATPSKAVQASNDPAFGATGARLAEAVDSLDRATTWLLSKVENEPQTGAGRRDAVSAAVRQCRRRLHAGRGSAGGASRRRRRAGGAHRPRAFLRREHRGAGVRAGTHRHRRRRQRQRRRRRADGMNDHVTVEDDGAVRTMRMNRPDKKNALTAAMYAAMAGAMEDANTDADIRCVVIAGVPGAFSAGNDLAEFSQAATAGEGLGAPVMRFLHALARSERPLVAAVQGLAVGIGTTMLLHCDHVVAGTDARFSTPFVGLGLVPEAASSLLAPRLMGHRRAFALLVMGRPLDAAAAQGLRPGQRGRRAGRGRCRGDEGRRTSPRCRPKPSPRRAD